MWARLKVCKAQIKLKLPGNWRTPKFSTQTEKPWHYQKWSNSFLSASNPAKLCVTLKGDNDTKDPLKRWRLLLLFPPSPALQLRSKIDLITNLWSCLFSPPPTQPFTQRCLYLSTLEAKDSIRQWESVGGTAVLNEKAGPTPVFSGGPNKIHWKKKILSSENTVFSYFPFKTKAKPVIHPRKAKDGKTLYLPFRLTIVNYSDRQPWELHRMLAI